MNETDPVSRPAKALAAVAVAIAVLAVTLSACSGQTSNDADSPKTENELLARLTNAKNVLDNAETIKFSLSADNIPGGTSGLLSAKGVGNHSPAFKGKVTVVTGGASLGADVIAVNGKVYAKTGFSPVFLTIDPASLGAPDPAQLLQKTGGISDLLINSESLAKGDKSRDGNEVLTTITGTLPGTVVQSLIPSADPSQSFDVTYRLTKDDDLHDATIEGPFYGTESVTYTIKTTTSDEPVTIKAP